MNQEQDPSQTMTADPIWDMRCTAFYRIGGDGGGGLPEQTTMQELLGYATLEMRGGLILRDCAVHQGGTKRWVISTAVPVMPELAQRVSPDRKSQFAGVIKFASKKARETWSDTAVAAIERYLAESEGQSATSTEAQEEIREDIVVWHYHRDDGWSRREVSWLVDEDFEYLANRYVEAFAIGPMRRPAVKLYTRLVHPTTPGDPATEYLVAVEMGRAQSEMILVDELPSLLALMPQLMALGAVAGAEQWASDLRRLTRTSVAKREKAGRSAACSE